MVKSLFVNGEVALSWGCDRSEKWRLPAAVPKGWLRRAVLSPRGCVLSCMLSGRKKRVYAATRLQAAWRGAKTRMDIMAQEDKLASLQVLCPTRRMAVRVSRLAAGLNAGKNDCCEEARR